MTFFVFIVLFNLTFFPSSHSNIIKVFFSPYIINWYRWCDGVTIAIITVSHRAFIIDGNTQAHTHTHINEPFASILKCISSFLNAYLPHTKAESTQKWENNISAFSVWFKARIGRTFASIPPLYSAVYARASIPFQSNILQLCFTIEFKIIHNERCLANELFYCHFCISIWMFGHHMAIAIICKWMLSSYYHMDWLVPSLTTIRSSHWRPPIRQ